MDRALKFGAGRYLQGTGVLEEAGREIGRYGRKAFVIGGPTAMGVVKQRLIHGLEAGGLPYRMEIHGGQCCHEAAREKVALARAEGCDVVVGVGGGRAMDFAKLCGHGLGARVVNIPTCSSTCASYAPFSLIYTPEGQTIPGNFTYEDEVAAILVDLEVMATQPARNAASGILDAMSKLVEITNGAPELRTAPELALEGAYALAQFTHHALDRLCREAYADIKDSRLTRAVEDAVTLSIPMTGIISALSRGVGQSALAHELYYQARLRFTRQVVSRALHGEIVGVGMIVQLYYNEMPDKIPAYLDLLRDINAPQCLSEIGIEPSAENVRVLFDAMAASAFVPEDAACHARLWEGLQRIAR